MSDCHNSLTFFFVLCFGIKYELSLCKLIEHNSLKIIIDMNKINIKPLGERVVVKPAAAEVKTASGIIIPDSAKEKPQQGTIVAIPAEKDSPVTVKEGDVVLYGKFAGTEITIEGENYLIMSQDDLLAII
jgi:chaperonin GroES